MIHVGIECGQRLWLPRSWRGSRHGWRGTCLRRFPGGFAIGPVMVWRRG